MRGWVLPILAGGCFPVADGKLDLDTETKSYAVVIERPGATSGYLEILDRDAAVGLAPRSGDDVVVYEYREEAERLGIQRGALGIEAPATCPPTQRPVPPGFVTSRFRFDAGDLVEIEPEATSLVLEGRFPYEACAASGGCLGLNANGAPVCGDCPEIADPAVPDVPNLEPIEWEGSDQICPNQLRKFGEPCGPFPEPCTGDFAPDPGGAVYVDPDSPIPGDGTMGAPYQFLEIALATGAPVILVGGGIFSSDVTIDRKVSIRACPPNPNGVDAVFRGLTIEAGVEGVDLVGGQLGSVDVRPGASLSLQNLHSRGPITISSSASVIASAIGVGPGGIDVREGGALDAGDVFLVGGQVRCLSGARASISGLVSTGTVGVAHPIESVSCDLDLRRFAADNCRDACVRVDRGTATVSSARLTPRGRAAVGLSLTNAVVTIDDLYVAGSTVAVMGRASEMDLAASTITDVDTAVSVHGSTLTASWLFVEGRTGIDAMTSSVTLSNLDVAVEGGCALRFESSRATVEHVCIKEAAVALDVKHSSEVSVRDLLVGDARSVGIVVDADGRQLRLDVARARIAGARILRQIGGQVRFDSAAFDRFKDEATPAIELDASGGGSLAATDLTIGPFRTLFDFVGGAGALDLGAFEARATVETRVIGSDGGDATGAACAYELPHQILSGVVLTLESGAVVIPR
jgi:hypothetical protein